MIGRTLFTNWPLSKLVGGFHLPQRLGDRGAILMITFQRDGPGPCERLSIGYKTGQSGKRFASQRGTERFIIANYLKCSKKRGSGAYSQEETCLNLVKLRGRSRMF